MLSEQVMASIVYESRCRMNVLAFRKPRPIGVEKVNVVPDKDRELLFYGASTAKVISARMR